MGLNGSSEPNKGIPSLLGCWEFPASDVWICVGKESEGGFSPGYVLLSFQTLTPSSGQPKTDCPAWSKATSTHSQTEENPPYKRGWLNIDSARRGGMNQNTQTPDKLPDGLILNFYPLNRAWRQSLECKPSDHEWYQHPSLAADEGRRWQKLSLISS